MTAPHYLVTARDGGRRIGYRVDDGEARDGAVYDVARGEIDLDWTAACRANGTAHGGHPDPVGHLAAWLRTQGATDVQVHVKPPPQGRHDAGVVY